MLGFLSRTHPTPERPFPSCPNEVHHKKNQNDKNAAAIAKDKEYIRWKNKTKTNIENKQMVEEEGEKKSVKEKKIKTT